LKGKPAARNTAIPLDKSHFGRTRARQGALLPFRPKGNGDYSVHVVDPNGFDVQISGIEMTAISG
jgi:hypothetical protein